MPSKKTKGTQKEKRFHLEFTLSSAFFWGLGLFLLLGWIFVLGILVGRGFLPGEVKALKEMKAQIAKLQEIVNRKDSSELEKIRRLNRDTKFAFYSELSTKKEETAKKRRPGKGRKQPVVNSERHPPGSDTGELFSVQVASLESELEAIKMVNSLVERKYPAYYYRVRLDHKTYYRVRCGKFRTREEASAFQKLLTQKENIRGFVAPVEK